MRTRMSGGVTGKAGDSLPMSILRHPTAAVPLHRLMKQLKIFIQIVHRLVSGDCGSIVESLKQDSGFEPATSSLRMRHFDINDL